MMEKKALWGHRAPGLSSRVKVPRLHTNLKPPPPAKPPVPKEKARVKKGHEVYSDEDKVRPRLLFSRACDPGRR